MQPRFQTQRVARAQTDRLDRRILQQVARERLGVLGRNRDLVAVLAGVAGAGDEPVAEYCGLHEGEFARFGLDGGESLFSVRALERDEGAVEQLEGKRRRVLAQQSEIFFPAARVYDDAHLVGEARDHQVVLDAAALIQKERVALGAYRPAVEVER